ncbi:MAG: rhodanese-like domain-containing protein [Bacteroidota bacterium]
MTQITVEELKKRLDSGEDIHLVDVREDHERADFNIGGIHHKLGQIQMMDAEPLEDWKNDEVVMYCRSGNRSGQASMILETMGFTNVVNLAGGMLAWEDKFGR